MRNPLRRHRPASPVPGEGAADARRRFTRRRWRRRLRAWRWVIVLVVLIAALCAGIWAVYFSSWLSVKGVEVDGPGHYVRPTLVERYAEAPVGEPLLTADLEAVETRLRANLPPLKTIDVSRSWPDRILVRVTERTPVAVVTIGGQLRALDEDGTVFLRLDAAPAGLPRVTSPAGTDSEALSGAAEVAAALPQDLAAKVDHVQVETVDAITLRLRDGRSVVWGSAADSDVKAEVLVTLMEAAPKAAQYDVSVPGNPLLSGARPDGIG